jgi:TonB family protein
MLSYLLKRVLPFALTLAFGVALGSLFRPAPSYRTRAVLVSDNDGGERHCCHARRNFKRSSEAVITYKPVPSYTDEARDDGISGSVELRVELRADGTVGEVLPVRVLPDGLTQEAIRAARRIRFSPKMVNGEAVDTTEWIEYYFDASEQSATVR